MNSRSQFVANSVAFPDLHLFTKNMFKFETILILCIIITWSSQIAISDTFVALMDIASLKRKMVDDLIILFNFKVVRPLILKKSVPPCERKLDCEEMTHG